MTDYQTASEDFPAPALLLCGACELALGHWDSTRPRCPRCWNLERMQECGE